MPLPNQLVTALYRESGPWPLLGALMWSSSHMYMSTVKGSCRLRTNFHRLTSAKTPERHAELVVCVGSVRRGSRSVKVTKSRATSRRYTVACGYELSQGLWEFLGGPAIPRWTTARRGPTRARDLVGNNSRIAFACPCDISVGAKRREKEIRQGVRSCRR